MTECMFLAGDDCPAARELADLDRQINLRMKAEAENQRLREALGKISLLSGKSGRYIDDYGDIARAALGKE